MKKACQYFFISIFLFFSNSYADEIHGVASIALQGTNEIIKNFEKQSGIKVYVEWLPSVDITKKLANGDKMDFVFYPSPENVDKILFKDKAENCFQFKEEEVVCPSNFSLLSKVPIQT